MRAVPLLVHGDCLLHRRLFSVPLLAVHLCLEANSLLCKGCPFVDTARLLFPLLLMMIQAKSIPFPVKLYVLTLRHDCLRLRGVSRLAVGSGISQSSES